MKKYEKPKIMKVSLLSDRKIANECWKFAQADPPKIYIHDPNGTSKGYIEFYITGSNCGNDKEIVNVIWYEQRDASGVGPSSEPFTVTTLAGQTLDPYTTVVNMLDEWAEDGPANPSFHGSGNIPNRIEDSQ